MIRLAEYASLLQLLGPAIPRQGRRIIALNEVWIVATLLAVIGLTVTLAGFYLWLRTYYSQDIALLGIGGTMLALSGIITGAALFFIRRAEAPLRNVATSMAHNSADLIKTVINELDDPIRENPAMAMSIAALSGYIAGEKVLQKPH